MGSKCSCIGGGDNGNQGGDLDEVPAIALERRQKFLLTTNWKGVSRHLKRTGCIMFTKMFEANPSLMEIFPGIRHLAEKQKDAWVEDDAFNRHCHAVMEVVDECVHSIDDTDKFFAILRKQAQMHAQRPGFKSDMFLEMREPFLIAVQTILEDRYTEQMEPIYQVLSDLIFETLMDETKKAQTD